MNEFMQLFSDTFGYLFEHWKMACGVGVFMAILILIMNESTRRPPGPYQ